MKYKLIASDFDDTFLSTKGNVSERQLQAVRDYQAKGGKFMLCSGRMFSSIREEAKRFDIHGDVICYNGAMIANLDSGEIKYHNPMSVESALDLIERLEAENRLLHVYIDDVLYIKEWTKYTDFYCESCKVGYTAVGKLSDFVKKTGKAVTQIIVIDAPENINDIHRRLETEKEYSATPSGANLLDIVSGTANKGNAVQAMCKLYGVNIDECVCFGDSPNDISMLEVAGLGVAVANARDIVKASADVITDSCDNDGVGKIIEKIIKGEA